MDRTQLGAWAAGGLGLLLLLVAAAYFAVPAHSLPGFVPGHASATSSEAGHHHVKHGIAALALGLGALAYAWMNSGPAREPD